MFLLCGRICLRGIPWAEAACGGFSGRRVSCGQGAVPAADSACGQGPCFRGRLCLRAGTSDRCAPAVLSLPPLRCGPLTVHEATGGYAVRSPCPSGIPLPRHNAPPLGCRDYSGFDLCAASIRKSGPEIKNRCTVCPRFNFFAASIRKSWAEFENRCTDCPCFDLMAASIFNSWPEIKNRCTEVPEMIGCAAVIANSGLKIKNRCSTIVSQKRMARLRSRCRYVASSDSNFRCRKVD